MRRLRATHRHQAGASLVELVVSIVVIGVGLAGILVVMDRNTRSSGDPVIQHQAIAIAEAYLEEVMVKEFNDPDGTNVGETRATFDNVSDYDGLTNNGARDQDDNAIAGLEQYNVTVAVSNQALNGVAAADALLVTVTVSAPGSVNYALSSFRTNY